MVWTICPCRVVTQPGSDGELEPATSSSRVRRQTRCATTPLRVQRRARKKAARWKCWKYRCTKAVVLTDDVNDAATAGKRSWRPTSVSPNYRRWSLSPTVPRALPASMVTASSTHIQCTHSLQLFYYRRNFWLVFCIYLPFVCLFAC